MSTPLDTLARPITLGKLDLSSRFVMAPMTRKRSPGGVPTAENAAYYRRRAEHGVGLIITEGALIGHPSASHEDDVPRLTPGPAEDGWRLVTSEVHAAGGRIAAQIWHLGSERMPAETAWTPDNININGFDQLLQAYAQSARVAAGAGFDAVEIHAAHGYLLDEFLWPHTNHRSDRFGGGPKERATFPAEVIRTVRDNIPEDMPLIVRFSQFKERDYAARIADTPTELGDILGKFAEAGADVLHASQRRFWEPAFAGDPANLAGWAKRLTGLPTITVGSVGLDQTRLADLAKHDADLVALGRVLITNPDWVTLATTGRDQEIRPYRKADEDIYH
ncbi:2,4-dienoyl-CoA reductase-like NADH-dependent reductase (Old Yellow Enzyme family) [Actinoplanes tereljensis]|uniref:12-oxophytodienoate reductase n=1 Tax=Paractinoplanes tereljensis TaxID=571912 RepID=A0A919TSZ5_9ACTN|nr:12-oxophytodienoate reductase [Actinoplanes tereljensis]GIF21948.1 12-oxophytodienoate reductase [Actinoplanes tereljensis]